MKNNAIPKMELGQEYKFDIENRYFLSTAESAMQGNVIRGLVELVTNCDDSYCSIEDAGDNVSGLIQISIQRKNKSKNIIKILDNAEGMNLTDMKNNLWRVGSLAKGYMESHGRSKRGLMGRGSKECIVLGDLHYQSIKDGYYSEAVLKKPAIFKPMNERAVNDLDRFSLGISKGNGTLITWEIEPQFKTPIHDWLVKNLPKYYSLRDMASSPSRTLILEDLNRKRKTPLFYEEIKGLEVFNKTISVPGYPSAKAELVIFKTDSPIKVDSSPYWEGGFLVKSNYAIHEVTSFSRDVENSLPYFEYYFGRLTCPYIDELVCEYEKIKDDNLNPTEENPMRIINPSRSGLENSHPFTKSLYKESAKYIRELIKKDEEKATENKQEIENKHTKERLSKLAKEVGKFIKENTEMEITEDENYLTSADIPSNGIKVIPGGLKILLNEEGKIYVYAKLLEEKPTHVEISTDSDAIELNTKILNLIDRGDGVLVNFFTVRGLKITEHAKIKIVYDSKKEPLPVFVSVVDRKAPVEIQDFQFEKDNYAVQVKKQKNIKILAKWPEFIHGRVKLKVDLENEDYCKIENKSVILDYNEPAKDAYGRRVAVASVRLAGVQAGGPVKISASLKSKIISANIRVIPAKESGSDFKIKIVDEDLGEQRAILKNNLIKINGRHEIVKRYLGPAEKGFEGQDSVHFKLLIAELVADTVARRILELNAEQHANKYKDMDVTGFYRQHREYHNKFLKVAHKVQISDEDIKTLKSHKMTN